MTVTQKVKATKQPYGGYVKISEFEIVKLNSKNILHDMSLENIHPSLVGMTVDYLSRFMTNKNVVKSFQISILGMQLSKIPQKSINKLLLQITGLNKQTIQTAIFLTTFDVVFRAGLPQKDPGEANEKTIDNVKWMVENSLNFFQTYGPIKKDGFTFDGAYNQTISSGDGDFLTKDTLWDFKVSKYKPKSKHILQIIIYYLMGKESRQDIFDNINYVGVFNPRLNIVYRLDIRKVNKETLKEIATKIIGYKDSKNVKPKRNKGVLELSDDIFQLPLHIETEYEVVIFFIQKISEIMHDVKYKTERMVTWNRFKNRSKYISDEERWSLFWRTYFSYVLFKHTPKNFSVEIVRQVMFERLLVHETESE